jgi:hypothetical protein
MISSTGKRNPTFGFGRSLPKINQIQIQINRKFREPHVPPFSHLLKPERQIWQTGVTNLLRALSGCVFNYPDHASHLWAY